MKKITVLLVLFVLFMGVLLGIRFLFGGPEDDWICSKGEWVMHGNPRAPKPTGGCGQNTQIANPASVYCEEHGGTLEIKTATNGGQFGWCTFSDGRECEEWDFFRTKVCEITPMSIPTSFNKKVTFEESKKIAENFVKNSPTYKFDGFGLKFESFQVMKCPSCWEFVFSFQCRQVGYGDRTDQILTQVITPHKIIVETVGDKITQTIIDEKYDELKQKLLE